jgi:hypothetical protein
MLRRDLNGGVSNQRLCVNRKIHGRLFASGIEVRRVPLQTVFVEDTSNILTQFVDFAVLGPEVCQVSIADLVENAMNS